jgi:hypothetical protein
MHCGSLNFDMRSTTEVKIARSCLLAIEQNINMQNIMLKFLIIRQCFGIMNAARGKGRG